MIILFNFLSNSFIPTSLVENMDATQIESIPDRKDMQLNDVTIECLLYAGVNMYSVSR